MSSSFGGHQPVSESHESGQACTARTGHTTRVCGYVRVSTAEQADSGAGLEAQRQAITAEALRRGWELVAIHEDAGASGKDLKRPGLQQALALIESDAAALREQARQAEPIRSRLQRPSAALSAARLVALRARPAA